MDDATPEEWQPVPGYEGYYEVSDLGRVRSVEHPSIRGMQKGRLLKLKLDGNTWRIMLSAGGSRKAFTVHALVAAAFLGPCPEGHEIKHRDGDRCNVALVNLTYEPFPERGPDDGTGERWLPISGWEGFYEVSDRGRVRRIRAHGRWGYYSKVTVIKPSIGKQGYYMVNLWRDGKPLHKMVHRLVARAFLGPRPDDLEIRHFNDNKLDNRVVNLVDGTHRENMLDIVRNGNHDRAKLTHCAVCGEPYDDANTYIPPDRPNIRLCRNCMRRRLREYRKRKKAGLVKSPKEAA